MQDAGDMTQTGFVKFDSNTKLFTTDPDLGPLELLSFDTTYVAGDQPAGTLAWDPRDNTVRIYHNEGTIQQVGQEAFIYAINNTANTIPDGTVVSHNGAELNGDCAIHFRRNDWQLKTSWCCDTRHCTWRDRFRDHVRRCS